MINQQDQIQKQMVSQYLSATDQVLLSGKDMSKLRNSHTQPVATV